MKRIMLLPVAMISLATFMQVRAQDQKEVNPFHSVVVSSDIVAELVLAKLEAVQTEFEGASESDMIVEVVDSVLNIRMKTGKYKDAKLSVRIYYNKDLQRLEANGRGQIWSDEDIYFEHNLSVKLFNGGEMRLNLICDSLNATVTQGSILQLKGSSRALVAKANTGGTFSGYEFMTQVAQVSASGGGKAKVSVSQSIKADASTKGFIGYVGEPVDVDQKTSMMGEILKTILDE